MLNRHHSYRLALLCFLFLCVLCGCGLFGDTKEDIEINDATSRVQRAIDDIDVRAAGTNATLGDFREASGRLYSDILVHIDFERLLQGVELDDFAVSRGDRKRQIDDLYADISLMFTRTDYLTIVSRNSEALDEYTVPEDMKDLKNIEIEVGRFIKSRDKFLRIDSEFGSLDVHSDFFYGRTGLGNIERLRLFFGYEEDTLSGASTIIFEIRDQRGNRVNAESPGRSALLTIPLDNDFMRDAEGRLLYDMVEYIDIDNIARGALPRSFVDSENLYIYAHRSGRFRLSHAAHGDEIQDRKTFLADRGIVVYGTALGNATVVTRGQMIDALMGIHWVENMFWDLTGVSQFPDVPTGDRLDHNLKVARNLNAFPITGYPDGFFRPAVPLERSHLFDMLAGYIATFGLEVDGLLPAIPEAIGMKDDYSATWWGKEGGPFDYLKARGFLPYCYIDGVAYLAPNNPVSVAEAEEILFKLITTKHY